MSIPDLPVMYCKKCGSKLVKERVWIEMYDPDTGVPIRHATLACPNRGRFISGHSKFDFRLDHGAWKTTGDWK